MTMAMEVAVVVIVTMMPTGPVGEACIIGPVDGSVIPIAIIGITVAVVVTVVVVDTAQYQCRCDARAYAPAPSMRFGPIGGAKYDHQAEGHSCNERYEVSRFHWVLLLRVFEPWLRASIKAR
jgi:hypothetical protein